MYYEIHSRLITISTSELTCLECRRCRYFSGNFIAD